MNSFQSDRRKKNTSTALNATSTFGVSVARQTPQGQDMTGLQAGHSLADFTIHHTSESGPAAPIQKVEAANSQEHPEQASSEERRENRTGLSDSLKAGVESLSGYSLDDMRVHYNSPKPAEVQALAYTQGTEIHVGPGQEQHLAHEAWHVVQQKQGRVQPTMQMKGVAINDDEGLEREADVMGARALQVKHLYPVIQAEVQGSTSLASSSPVQRVGEAKASLTRIDPSSSEVPDLPQVLVDQLKNAKTSTDRQKVLDNLLAYKPIQDVIEQPPTPNGPPLTVLFVYKDTKGGKLADTQYKSSGKQASITITFFSTVFDQYSPAAIYSTLRHELIHAAQRTQSPDDITSGAMETDEYMHENNETTGAESDVGKKTYKEIQAPLQEIETHVWEIQHAAETGIDRDADYVKATWQFIEEYTDQLVKNLPKAGKKVVKYWNGYINRAINQLKSLSKVTGDQGDKLAIKLEAAQLLAVNNLTLPKGGKTTGGLVGVTKKGP